MINLTDAWFPVTGFSPAIRNLDASLVLVADNVRILSGIPEVQCILSRRELRMNITVSAPEHAADHQQCQKDDECRKLQAA